MKFIDTNVFIRFLTRDDPEKSAAAAELLTRVEDGLEEVSTCEAVIAEIVYVLTRGQPYRIERELVVDSLRTLLTLRGLHVPEKSICLRAVDVFASHPSLDFEDALQVAHMEAAGITEIVSYDGDFDRVPGVVRVEP